MKTQVPCFALLLIAPMLCAQPQDSTAINQLSEVVVTATRSQRLIATLPLPTQLITAATMKRSGSTRLHELLAQQTGLPITSSFAGAQGVQIQGLDAAYTMILVDGLPLLGRSSGTLDLSRVSVGNIDRIEIVKGASSSLYGSEALAGVINIITKNPIDDSISGSLSIRYASLNTMDSDGMLNWKNKKMAFSLFADYYSSEGYDLDPYSPLKTVEPYQNLTLHPKIGYEFSKSLHFWLSGRYYCQKQRYTSLIQELYYAGESALSEWNTQAKLLQKWSPKFSTDYELYYSNYKNSAYLKDAAGLSFENNFFDQGLKRLEIRNTFLSGLHLWILGMGLNKESLDRTYFRESVGFASRYAYLQFDYNPALKWNILAGLRYDQSHQYQSQLSPKLAINYKISPEFSIKSSLGYGFKAPDFRQLYFDFSNSSIGYTVLGYKVAEEQLQLLQSQGQLLRRSEGIYFDKALKPESSINVNFGAYYQRGNIKTEANVFYNVIKNLIDTRAVAQKTNGKSVFSYFNIDQVFTYGLEYNASTDLGERFSVSGGYQYLIAKDKAVIRNLANKKVFARDPNNLSSFQLRSKDYIGLFNRSRHSVNLKLFYRLPSLKSDIHLQFFYRSKYGLWDSNNNQILDSYDDFVDSYTLTNLSFRKQFKSFTLQAGANNLFDFTNPKEISSISGRQLFVKLEFNY